MRFEGGVSFPEPPQKSLPFQYQLATTTSHPQFGGIPQGQLYPPYLPPTISNWQPNSNYHYPRTVTDNTNIFPQYREPPTNYPPSGARSHIPRDVMYASPNVVTCQRNPISSAVSAPYYTSNKIPNIHADGMRPQDANSQRISNLTGSNSTPVTKWGISFDGSASGLAVEKFFFRAEHMARTNNVDLNLLLNDMPVLLKGLASEHYWLMLEQHPGCDWHQLKTAFLHRFQDRRTDVDITRLINGRKQRVKESFTEFYYDIVNLALPLKVPFSELQLLEILKRNMGAGLQIHLAGRQISSISELVSTCVAIEDVWRSVGLNPEQVVHRNLQPIPRVHEMDLHETQNVGAYARSSASQVMEGPPFLSPQIIPSETHSEQYRIPYHLEAVRPTPPVYQPQSPNSQTNLSVQTCWNCRRLGHCYTDCDIIRSQIFCYGCGAPEILKPHCLVCNNRSGNRAAGMRRPGILHLRQLPTKPNQPDTPLGNPVNQSTTR